MNSDEVNGLLQTIDDPERADLQRQMILSPREKLYEAGTFGML